MSEVVQQSKSSFVTVLGWLTIAFFGFGLLVVLGRVGFLVFALGFYGRDAIVVLAGTIAFSAPAIVGLVSGIGLLKRLNWARIALVVILAVAILVTIAGFALLDPDSETVISFGAAETGRLVVTPNSTVFGVGVLFFYVFCIYKLTRPEVKKEFGVQQLVAADQLKWRAAELWTLRPLGREMLITIGSYNPNRSPHSKGAH